MYNSSFTASRKHIACKHTINGSAEQVFPLLCPVREFEWIEKWDCEIIYSQSGIAELGCVFSIYNADNVGKDIWVISKYVPSQCVRVNSLRSIRYGLTLTENTNTTDVLWQQEITALNEQGNEFVATIEQGDFDKQIKMLEELLNYYIENGKAKVM